MRYYLTTWALSEEGFVPRGADGDWACIDLRPDGSRPDGLALLWCKDAVTGPTFDLGDDPDDRSAARKRGIESRLGLTLDSVDLRAVALELLIGHARTDRSRWRPLRASRRRRRFEVWLGPLLATMPAAAGGAVITESFNTADGSTLGPDLTWAEVIGNWAISSNTASVPTNNNCSARAESDLATDDHYAEADVSWLNAASRQCGTAVRFFATGTGGTSADYYCTRANANGDNVLMQKAVDNTFTTLSTTARTIGVETLTVRTEIDGSSLTGIVGGTSYPTTDTEITGNLRTGICGFVPATGETATWDNFEAGDLAVNATATPAVTALTATAPSPTVSAGATLEPATVPTVVSLPAPNIETGSPFTVTPDAVPLVTAAPAASLTAQAAVTPGVIAATVAEPAPTVSAEAVTRPVTVPLTATAPISAISAGSTVTPAAAPLAATIPAAALSLGAGVTPVAVTLMTTAPAPTVAAGVTITPTAVGTLVTVPFPTVTAFNPEGNATSTTTATETVTSTFTAVGAATSTVTAGAAAVSTSTISG